MLIFPIALAVIAGAWIKARRFTPEAYAGLCILGSCFIFEQSWWARYIPQLWLIAPLAYYAASGSKARWITYGGRTVANLGILTGIICSITTFLGAYRYTARRQAIYDILAPGTVKMAAPQPQFVRMFEEQGIAVVETDGDSIAPENREMLLGLGVFVSNQTDPWFIELTPANRAELDRRLRSKTFYKAGIKIRKLIGKDENIPFYN